MKQLICLLLLSPFLNAAHTQNIATDSSAPVVAYWNFGDKKTLTIHRTTEKIKGSIKTAAGSSTCQAIVSVIDSSKEGYTLQWQYKNVVNRAALSVLPDMNNLLENLVIVYKTDDVGSFTELVNYEEVKGLVNSTYSSLAKQIKDTSAELKQVMAGLQAAFQSRESIEQLVLKEISLFHTPFGVEYTLRRQEQATALPNFLGGEEWPATQTFQLKALPAGGVARIIMEQFIDEKKAADILKAFLKKISAGSGEKMKEGDFPTQIVIKDYNEFDVWMNSGWLKRAYVKRVVKTGDLQKTEVMEITVQE